MPWVRIDEGFAQHPKLMQVGPLGMALQVAALCYCNKHLTDGFIPWAAARSLLSWEFLGPGEQGRKRYRISVVSGVQGEDVTADFVVRLLVDAGLWQEVDGGYIIHDYLDYQPSRAEVLAEREQRREAGRKGGLASAQARALARAQADPQAPPQVGAQAGAQASAQADAQADAQAGAQAGPQADAQASAQAPPQAKFKPVPVPVPDPVDNPPSVDSTFRSEESPPLSVDNTRAQKTRAERDAPDGASACGSKAAEEKEPYSAEFEEFWQQYPRRVEKRRAWRCWKTRLREGYAPDSLIAAARHYGDYCRQTGTEERFIKHPATFLGPDKPFLEWLQPRASPGGNGRVPKAWPVLREYLRKHAGEVDTS